MDLSGIISISGKSGLFKMVGQMKNGIIVQSLVDGKRFPAYATNKVSALEDISIYGYSEDVPLGEVYDKLYALEEGKPSLSSKASINEMRSRLREAFADFDEERVYASDLKKLFAWYNLLIEHDLLKPDSEEEEKSTENTSTEVSDSEEE